MTDLELDGDRDIYALQPDWWNLDRRFTISDLNGIEHCSAITRLSLGQGMFDGCSLAPLVDLAALCQLSMSALDNHRDLNALVSLPALTDFEVSNLATAGDRETWNSVIAE